MKKIVLILAATALASSCVEDARNNYMVDDSLSLVYQEDAVVPVSVYAQSKTITVLKSGKGTLPAKAQLDISAEGLAGYNEANETSYKSVLTSVELSSNSVEFAAGDITRSVTLSWDADEVSAELDGDMSVIPVAIVGADIDVNPKRNLVLVNLLNSSVGFTSSGSTTLAGTTPGENGEVSVKIAIDNAMPEDLTVRAAVDNSLADAYNTEKGTSYTTCPDGYVSLPPDGVVIKAGSSDAFMSVTLNNAALFDDGGSMKPFRTMVVPLRLTGTSQKGVTVSDKAYYLLVNSPFEGASISRVWGRYSTSEVWTLFYGLPSGSDRNLTLDENWVYLPYAVGGSVAKITGLSVDDPETTCEVNTAGFVPNTITTACVRVIDRGDGTSMLTASGANDDHFAFYAWKDGTDSDPEVYSLECTWRRSGDRYEMHGNWADGTLYVHSYQGTFSTRYAVRDGAFVKTERTLVNVPYTGFGGLYEYPGAEQMIFASSDAAAFLTPTGDTYKAGDGQDVYDMSAEPFDGAEMTFGYRAFTCRGEKYIAYTAFDKDDGVGEDGVTPCTTYRRARLVVVKDKGGFKASLAGDEKDIFFEAPIQGEEFTDIAVEAPLSAQADCAVIEIGDKVLIAAGAQGLGVSLFKME